jgi:hypothetical protein
LFCRQVAEARPEIPSQLTSFFQGGDPDQILDCTTHKYFNLLDCISPYREPSSAFDQRLRVTQNIKPLLTGLKDIPFRKQSKQALQTVTNTNVGANSPATSGDAVTPIQRTVSTPTVFHPSLTSFDNFSPIIMQNSDKATRKSFKFSYLKNILKRLGKIQKICEIICKKSRRLKRKHSRESSVRIPSSREGGFSVGQM